MNNQSYEITVDTRKSISHSNIEFSQNNLNISELIFNITEDGTNFTLNDTDKIIVYFEKPDKTVVFQDKEVELLDKEKGKIKVLLTSQTLVKAGDVKGQISIERIEDGTRKRVNTYDFSFKVRSSIASNDSIESTNEFQIFDKIMVAGEKFKDFEDEDFDELIAAGELAKGALPKSGGTMTGNLLMNNPSGAISHRYSAGATPVQVGWEALTDGQFRMYDWKNNRNVLSYDPVTDVLNINRGTNVVKSAGDTMTGDLRIERGTSERAFHFYKNGATTTKLLDNDNTTALYSVDNAETVWRYNKGNKTFEVMSSNTNLVKKTGDTITGVLTLSGVASQLRLDDKAPSIRIDQPSDTTTTSARGFTVNENNVIKGGVGRIRNGTSTDQMYIGWGENPWSENTSLTVSDTKLLYKNKPVAMRDKDGQTTLTLTAEATNVNSGYMPLVERRGNTVTMRMEISRNANSTSPVVCNLPADLRPPITLSEYFVANDGTAVGVNVIWDGKVEVYTTGKPVKIVFTYVVN
ncbi:BppU family phage baseplate upper protein [Bacillus cereus group sp. Bc015]|uniref:BppU family phage baseplate upper protein n=1 Tax=unclassified Bacillus cereus group TaxID=2750818 RepID=UPI00019FFB72|nr:MULTISPECIES: BppU family phage baseplate upper protein [unclassified Bacillus cereus group]EEK41864.1 hypothetical protein bcere0001_52770 [Bacillus cereus m1293]MDA2738506.1 BppU family phage baseplate upper protein [Bacillus cereus group sp. Bc015]